MKMTINIRHQSAKISKSIAKSIEPDNLLAPSTVRIKTKRWRNVTATSITCSGSLETFIATIDDLLLCMDAARKTLEAIKDEEPA